MVSLFYSTKMDFQIRPWLEVMMKKYVRENTIQKVVEVDLEPAVPKGDNHASLLERAKITVVLGSGRMTTTSAIIKRLPEKELFTKFLEEYSLFKTETKVYADVLSEMEYLMIEYGDKDDKLWPDFFGHRSYDTIIFNDLKEMNYQGIDRKEMLDKNHGYLAVRSLARYHAMTVVLYKKGIIHPAEFGTFFFASNTKAVNRMLKGGMELFGKVMKEHWGPEWHDLGKKIEALSETCCDRLEDISRVDSSKLNVLCHGDFWTCNVMFKYSPCSGHDYPIGIRFVDFQMSHWNSYAFDLIYFLYTALKPELRRSQFDKIIEAYHETLLYTFKFYNYNSPKIPTLEEVKEELKRVSFFGFMSVVFNLAVNCTSAENPLDLGNCMIDDDEVYPHNSEIYNDETFKKYVQKELKQWVAEGVI